MGVGLSSVWECALLTLMREQFGCCFGHRIGQSATAAKALHLVSLQCAGRYGVQPHAASREIWVVSIGL